MTDKEVSEFREESNINTHKSILFFLVDFNKGGAEWVITNLANTMADNGREVFVASIKTGSMAAELSSKITYLDFSSHWFNAFWYVFKELRRNNFNVIFTSQRGASVFAYLLKSLSLSKTKHVVREAASNFMSSLDSKGTVSAYIWKHLYRASYNGANRLIVNSERTGEDLIYADILSYKKYTKIDNPLDIDHLKKKALMSTNFPKPSDVFQIVTIARLVPHKCIETLIFAFDLVRVKYPKSRLIIVGDGPLKDELHRLVHKLDIVDHVLITGWLQNPYPILKGSDLFVLPSQWEGFGQALIEALAFGVPCVSTKHSGGPSYILDNGQFGILVEPGSVDELALGIKCAMSQEHDKRKLVRRAEKFNKEAITKEYEKVIFLE